MQIIPTVGRVVYVRVAGLNDRLTEIPGIIEDDVVPLPVPPQQPFAALITFVHNENLINVAGYDHNGGTLVQNSIALIPSDQDLPPTGTYAHWMPYQVSAAGVKPMLDPAPPAA